MQVAVKLFVCTLSYGLSVIMPSIAFGKRGRAPDHSNGVQTVEIGARPVMYDKAKSGLP